MNKSRTFTSFGVLNFLTVFNSEARRIRYACLAQFGVAAAGGLSIDLLLKSGIDIKQVQKLAAHTDESITSGYTANHPPEYKDLGIVVSDEIIGK